MLGAKISNRFVEGKYWYVHDRDGIIIRTHFSHISRKFVDAAARRSTVSGNNYPVIWSNNTPMRTIIGIRILRGRISH